MLPGEIWLQGKLGGDDQSIVATDCYTEDKMLTALKRFILWDYPRGGWQYDVMVIGILSFIFLTPKDLFHDQPIASSIVMLPTDGTDHRFWIGRSLLETIPEPERLQRVGEMLHKKMEKKQVLFDLTPIIEDNTVRGYIAHTRPEK